MTLAKPPNSASVKLTSFCLYRVHGTPGTPDAQIEVVAGAEAGRFTEDGKIQLLLKSAPFHSDAFGERAPKDGEGVLALYGHRDALQELQFWRERARHLHAQFAYIDYEVKVGEISQQLVNRAMLKDTGDAYGFLNIRRMQADFQKEVLHRFQVFIKKEGGDFSKEMDRVSQIALRPDLFAKWLAADADVRHVKVMVLPVADDIDAPGRIRQVALIRPDVCIFNTTQGDERCEILFPSWMKVHGLADAVHHEAKKKK
ncbi:hypothetical protein [Paucibacter soli]|uniref:hypothetical protein n=1 Tax=Paucibacter soli TaxID=3133433 RepID=UPI0030988F55